MTNKQLQTHTFHRVINFFPLNFYKQYGIVLQTKDNFSQFSPTTNHLTHQNFSPFTVLFLWLCVTLSSHYSHKIDLHKCPHFSSFTFSDSQSCPLAAASTRYTCFSYRVSPSTSTAPHVCKDSPSELGGSPWRSFRGQGFLVFWPPLHLSTAFCQPPVVHVYTNVSKEGDWRAKVLLI